MVGNVFVLRLLLRVGYKYRLLWRLSSRRFYLFDLGTQDPSEMYIMFSIYRTYVIERLVGFSGRGEYPMFGLRYHGSFNYYKIRIDTTCNCIQVSNRSVFHEFWRGQGGCSAGQSGSDFRSRMIYLKHFTSVTRIAIVKLFLFTLKCFSPPADVLNVPIYHAWARRTL